MKGERTKIVATAGQRRMRKVAGHDWSGRFPAIAIVLSLAIHGILLAAIAHNRPEYLRDYRTNADPDAIHYVTLGHNVWQHGAYSRCGHAPYSPDMLRTPIYPVIAGALDLLAGPAAIYVVQGLLQAGSCWLLFRLTLRLFSRRAAVWASLFFASDLMLAIHNFQAMSEPLFVFLLLASLDCLVPAIVDSVRGVPTGNVRFLAGGLLLGLAILTRPAALYLPVVLIAAGLIAARGRTAWAVFAKPAVLLSAAAVLLPGLWMVRNTMVFGVCRLTSVDAGNNVYFAAAGAYQLRDGLNLQEAQERIRREFDLPPYRQAQNPWIAKESVAQIDAKLRQATGPLLKRYPLELVESSVLGVGKASVAPNAAQLADLLGTPWIAPGTHALLTGRRQAWNQLRQNSPVVLAVLACEGLHIAAGLSLALMGLISALRMRARRGQVLLLLTVLGYFYLTMALFGMEAPYRCRIPVLTFLYILVGIGLRRLSTRFIKPDRLPQQAARLRVAVEAFSV